MAIRLTEFPEPKTPTPPAEETMHFVTLDEAARRMGAPSVQEMLDLLDVLPPHARRRVSDYLGRIK